jgi:hypothetical protein
MSCAGMIMVTLGVAPVNGHTYYGIFIKQNITQQ